MREQDVGGKCFAEVVLCWTWLRHARVVFTFWGFSKYAERMISLGEFARHGGQILG